MTAVVAAAVVVVAAAGAVAYLSLVRSGSEPEATETVESGLAGLMTSAAPWPPNAELLAERLDAIGLPALTAEGTVVHIHPRLEIAIDGNLVPVPAAIGLDPNGTFIAPIHTHDASGTIHVESPEQREFSLGQFFDVWGLRFDARCIGPYCAGNGARLLVLVDDREVRGPRALTLRDGQEILVLYESA